VDWQGWTNMHNITRSANYHYTTCAISTTLSSSIAPGEACACSVASYLCQRPGSQFTKADTVDIHFRPATTLRPSQTHVRPRSHAGPTLAADLAQVFYGQLESLLLSKFQPTRQTGARHLLQQGLPTSKSQRSSATCPCCASCNAPVGTPFRTGQLTQLMLFQLTGAISTSYCAHTHMQTLDPESSSCRTAAEDSQALEDSCGSGCSAAAAARSPYRLWCCMHRSPLSELSNAAKALQCCTSALVARA
jgi:hypothetical protein